MRSGRDFDGNRLSTGERVFRGALGSFELGTTAFGLKTSLTKATATVKNGLQSLRVPTGAPTSGAIRQSLPGTVVDLSGDVLLYSGRQHARALVNEAAQSIGVNASRYVDDVVVVSRNVHGDSITPWFEVINGRRTIALTPQTLGRSRAWQLVDTFHEFNHARQSTLLGHGRYSQLYSGPLQQARIEVLVQGRAIQQTQRHLGNIHSRVLNAERTYIDNWSRVYFNELFGQEHLKGDLHMKISPFNLYLRSLAHGPVKLGYVDKQIAYERLKRLSGEDFGFDVECWREWGKSHTEVSELMTPTDAANP